MRKLLAILGCVSLLLTACSVSASNPSHTLFEVRHLYNNSSEVILGTLEDITVRGNETYGLVKVQKSYAGRVEPNSVVSCLLEPELETGKDYLFFMNQSDYEPVFAEDAFTFVANGQMEIAQDQAIGGSGSLSASELYAQLESMGKIVSAPHEFAYYNSSLALAKGSDSILVGRITSVSDQGELNYHSSARGSDRQFAQDSVLVEIDVLSVYKGIISPRTQLSVVYSPSMLLSTINESTLMNVPYTEDDTPAFEPGRAYLFFLSDSPDSKQTYQFFVNPVQGFIPILGDQMELTALQRQIFANFDLQTVLSDMVYQLARTDIENDHSPIILDEN